MLGKNVTEEERSKNFFNSLRKLTNDIRNDEVRRNFTGHKDENLQVGIQKEIVMPEKLLQQMKVNRDDLDEVVKTLMQIDIEKERLQKCAAYIRRFENLKKEYLVVENKDNNELKNFESFHLVARKASLKKEMFKLKERLNENSIREKNDYIRQVEEYKFDAKTAGDKLGALKDSLEGIREDVKETRQFLKKKIRETRQEDQVISSKQDVVGVLHFQPDRVFTEKGSEVLSNYRLQVKVLDQVYEDIQRCKTKVEIIKNGIEKQGRMNKDKAVGREI